MLFHRCFGIRISSPFHLDTLNIPIQNTKCPENAKNECPRTSYFPPPFFVKLELCRLCMSMPNTICADRQCYPWIILLCAVLRAVYCDKSWKWTESFVFSSSKHEFCFHVFHPWSLLHFRSHQAWLALAAQWPDFCFALKPVTEVWSSWLQLNKLVPIRDLLAMKYLGP